MKSKRTHSSSPGRDLGNVLGELAHLNNLPRSDFYKAGVTAPVSIGAFSALAAQLSFIIAAGEKVDPCRAASMSLFSMLPNSRVGVVDYLARPFIKVGEIREKALKTQLEDWPNWITGSLGPLVSESELRESAEARCAYEGYRLASAYFDALYRRRGNPTKSAWISSARDIVMTATGKAILSAIESGSFEDWWQGFTL